MDPRLGTGQLSQAQPRSAVVPAPGGLSTEEAQRRLAQYGENAIHAVRVSALRKLLSYFWGPIPWMIEAAAVLSAIVHHWSDFIIITVLLLANAVVGFWEEYQAGNAIAALKARLAPHARVKRDGAWTDIAARLLVPGDIVRLRLGDIVPADSRSLGPDPVEVDQAALTGESLPVSKKTGEVLYSGAIVRQGETDAVVPQEVERVIQAVADQMGGEIQRSLDFYASTAADGKITKAFLSGGTARIPALFKVVEARAGVPVEILNPFRNVEVDDKRFDPAAIVAAAPSAAVGVGLALRRAGDK